MRILSAEAAATTVAAGIATGSTIYYIIRLRRLSPSAIKVEEYYYTISTRHICVVLDQPNRPNPYA
jgi:hypothetical protein